MDDIDKKLAEIHKEVRQGHAALQQRHDRTDQELGYLHHKMDRLRGFLYTLWTAVVEVFKKSEP
jgi:hypothetical protein